MLQMRRENEQFAAGKAYVDRPDSSQLVDLHVYLVPKSVWSDIHNLAENEAMRDAVSAGFVRVQPEMKLSHLRHSIEKACGSEVHFPRDFTFLRSVGRCFTRVKPGQENELKVKNYRPPQTAAPEVYLLEGRHDEHAYAPSASPNFSSVNYLFGNRFHFGESNRSPTKHSHHRHLQQQQQQQRRTDHVERARLPVIRTSDLTSHYLSPSRKDDAQRELFVNSDSDTSSVSRMSTVTNNTSKSLSKLKQEQERLRKRQAELERMRRAAEERRLQSERDETRRETRRQEKVQPERKDVADDTRRQDKAQSERRRQEKTKPERKKEEPTRQETPHSDRVRLAEQRRSNQEETAAVTIQATYRGFKQRQAFRERQINLAKGDSRKSSAASHATLPKPIVNARTIDLLDDELSDGSEIPSRSSSIGSSSEDERRQSRAETRLLTPKHRESPPSSSTDSERKLPSKLSASSKKIEKSASAKVSDIEENRAATVTKSRPVDEEDDRGSVASSSASDDDRTYELKRREVELKKRRQQQEDKHKVKEPVKAQQRGDPEVLRARLQQLRSKRRDLERAREEVIGRLKTMHNRLATRRHEARELWKKKYYQEKKRTVPAEQYVAQSTAELDKLYKKIEQLMDNECKTAAEAGRREEAKTGRSFVALTHTQREVQALQLQIEQAKLRLSTDIKLRSQAESECQLLKHELNQARRNLNQMKTRIGS